MELTFEYEKDLFAGSYPAVVVRADETLGYVYKGTSGLCGRRIVINTADHNSSTIESETSIAIDTSPELIEVRHVGPQNWLLWKNGNSHRVAMVPEAPKVMNEAFFKGFITGNLIRNGNLNTSAKFIPTYGTDIPDEDRISYNNGLLLGQIGTL